LVRLRRAEAAVLAPKQYRQLVAAKVDSTQLLVVVVPVVAALQKPPKY